VLAKSGTAIYFANSNNYLIIEFLSK